MTDIHKITLRMCLASVRCRGVKPECPPEFWKAIETLGLVSGDGWDPYKLTEFGEEILGHFESQDKW